VGTTGSVFVFALAPATRVLAAEATGVLKVGLAKDEKKADTPIACVLGATQRIGADGGGHLGQPRGLPHRRAFGPGRLGLDPERRADG
jgi:hypothetical protein